MRTRGEYVGVADFGSRTIRVLIARSGADGIIEVMGCGAAPADGCVSQGVIQDLKAAKTALKEALMLAENEARRHVSSLFCGVHGKNVETFIREGRVQAADHRVTRRQMDEARGNAERDIQTPGTHIIASVTGEQWYVDDLPVAEPLGVRGQALKLRTHLARIPAFIHENIASCVEAQGRELEDVVFLPLASALGCLTPEDMELGAAVLDMGRRTTSLAVVRDGQVLGTNCFEWGGYHLTCDVAAGLHVSFIEADELILEYGLSSEFLSAQAEHEAEEDEEGGGLMYEEDGPPDEDALIELKTALQGRPSVAPRHQLDEILYARAWEQMEWVRRYLHSTGLMKHLVRGVVLTGGASTIENQQTLAESVLQVPCRIGYPRGLEIVPEEAQAPEYSAATGIVRHAFAFREAARNGSVDSRGAITSGVKRVWEGIREYFF